MSSRTDADFVNADRVDQLALAIISSRMRGHPLWAYLADGRPPYRSLCSSLSRLGFLSCLFSSDLPLPHPLPRSVLAGSAWTKSLPRAAATWKGQSRPSRKLSLRQMSTRVGPQLAYLPNEHQSTRDNVASTNASCATFQVSSPKFASVCRAEHRAFWISTRSEAQCGQHVIKANVGKGAAFLNAEADVVMLLDKNVALWWSEEDGTGHGNAKEYGNWASTGVVISTPCKTATSTSATGIRTSRHPSGRQRPRWTTVVASDPDRLALIPGKIDKNAVFQVLKPIIK